MKKLFLIVTACTFTLALSQAAILTTAPAGGTTTTFTVTGLNQPAPNPSIVNGFTITGNFRDGDSAYGLSSNGSWDHFSWVGTFGSGTPFQIDLGGLYSTAGGFVNYAPGNTPNPMISAIGADGTTVLETDDISLLAPIATLGVGNSGAFRGITLASPTIRFLRVGGAFIVEHDVTTAGPAGPTPTPTVPEPSTLLLACLPLTALWGVSLVKRSVRRPRTGSTLYEGHVHEKNYSSML